MRKQETVQNYLYLIKKFSRRLGIKGLILGRIEATRIFILHNITGGHGGNAVPRAQLQQPNHSRPEHDSSRHPATYNSPYPFTASSKSTGKGKIVEYNTKNYKAGDSILPTPSPNKSGDSILPIPHLSTRSQHGNIILLFKTIK